LCSACKAEAELPASALESLKKDFEALRIPLEQTTFMKPVGCNHCSKTGYRGRLAIHEVLEVTEEIAAATMSRLSSGEINKIALSQGMLSLRLDGLAKAAMGLTSLEEVFRVLG
jgi:type IV pilus assembly protein PilB